MQAVVYWQPETDPGTVVLTGRTPLSGQEPTPLPELNKDSARHDPDGLSLRLGSGVASVRLLLIDSAEPGMSLTALIPIDESSADRIEALRRLSQLLRRRPSIADTRLTVHRRRRLRQMLQAIDGHLDGASYRNIAKELYGEDRVAEHPWKTSSLRDSTIALVRDGRALIDGGYRGLLLRQRRR